MSHSKDLLQMYDKFFPDLIADRPRMLTPLRFSERLNHLLEEMNEMTESQNAGDLPGVADALVDLVYLAVGTAVEMGLPWETLWADVHRANMTKQRGVNPKRGHGADLIKPPGWVGPMTANILAAHGMLREACSAPMGASGEPCGVVGCKLHGRGVSRG